MRSFCHQHNSKCEPNRIDADKPIAFFAYPSNPTVFADTFERAITQISGTSDLHCIDWKQLEVEGRYIFCEICRAIRASSILVADITTLNVNVLFEFGFAIGCGIPVWPVISKNADVHENKLYDKLQTLTTIGHSKYEHSGNLAQKFLKKTPWNRKSGDLLRLAETHQVSRAHLLYLKSSRDDEYSVRLTELMEERTEDSFIYDDPQEVGNRSISWYVTSIMRTHGVVIHLDPSKANGALHNARCSFVAGLATALGKQVLMVVEDGFSSPIDYATLIQKYKSAKDIPAIINRYIADIKESTHTGDSIFKEQPTSGILERVDIGDFVAENEAGRIQDIYVDNEAARSCDREGYTLVVGRRGTGKTALYFKLRSAYLENKRTFLCDIKPLTYDLEQLIHFLQRTDGDIVKSHYIHTIWKFLIYTELISKIKEELDALPPHYIHSPAESAIMDLMAKMPFIKDYSFATRLKSIIDRLKGDSTDGAIRGAEIIHKDYLKEMKRCIIEYACTRDKIAIVIDGLDSGWQQNEKISALKEILAGLIEVGADIVQDLQDKKFAGNRKVNVSFVTMIRSDIYNIIQTSIPERDKLKVVYLYWDDLYELFKIVDARIVYSLEEDIDAIRELWDEMGGRDLILREMEDYVIRRPRDVLYFVAELLSVLKMSRTGIASQNAFKRVREKYSDFVLDGFVCESHEAIPEMSELLYGFMAKTRVLGIRDIREVMRQAGIPEQHFVEVVGYLCANSFLQPEVSPGEFQAIRSPEGCEKIMRKHKAFVRSKAERDDKYQIHKALWHALSLQP